MSEGAQSIWTSLEVAKLVVSLFTPVAVLVIGYFIQRQLAEQNRSWSNQQRIIERRLQVYDEVRNELNRIYCFVEDVGSWKEDTPESIIGFKRIIDRAMHTQRAIWRNETFAAYIEYINSAFSMYQGVGTDARIRASATEKRVGIQNWNPVWESRLTGQRNTDHKQAYEKLMGCFSRDLELGARSKLNS